MRYAMTGRGVLWLNGQATPKRVRFQTRDGEEWRDAALGVEIHADAIQGRVVLPQFENSPTPSERSDWLRELIVTDVELPEGMSVFDRDSMADSADAFAAMWDWTSGDPDVVSSRTGCNMPQCEWTSSTRQTPVPSLHGSGTRTYWKRSVRICWPLEQKSEPLSGSTR